ncbi:MAG: HU family DNA-binding protein [Prevotellaceae bacterium]|nr:HU family DNA-binding protein [Prevotellaceae bacterium]
MLKYTIVMKNNPKTETVVYSGQLVKSSPVKLEELAQEISSECTVTIHDVKAVLSAMERQIARFLRNGNSVRLGDLGSFHARLHCKTETRLDAFGPDNVLGLRVRFRPSTGLRYQLSKKNPSVGFQRVDAA